MQETNSPVTLVGVIITFLQCTNARQVRADIALNFQKYLIVMVKFVPHFKRDHDNVERCMVIKLNFMARKLMESESKV